MEEDQGHKSRLAGRRDLRERPWKNTALLDLEGMSGGLGPKDVESVVPGQLLENLDTPHAISFAVEAR